VELPRLRSPLPALRVGRSADSDLAARRAAGAARMTGDKSPPLVLFGGIDSVVVGTDALGPVIVHLHGGGYRMGSAAGWTEFAQRLAARCEATVVVPDYALAPERPFPAALYDVIAVLAAAASKYSGRPLVLSGDSAGGGLALAVAAALADRLLTRLILLSPWIDLRLGADSFQRCAATDMLFSLPSAQAGVRDYCQDWPVDDPLVTPLLADFSTLPPVCLQASSTEVLADDAVELALRLMAAKVPLELLVMPDLPHVWPVLEPDHPHTSRAIDIIAAFVRSA